MLLTVLSLIHNALTLLFGVYVSAAFLGVKMNRKNVFVLLLFSIIVGGVYLGSYLWLGTSGTEKIYPFIIHLPLMLFLAFRFKYGATLSSFAVLTAYLCCQISNWVGLAALSICNEQWLYYSVRIVITVATFILLIRYVSDATSALIQKSTKTLLILGIIPFVYYLFDYVTRVYTSLLYSGMEVVSEFLGFMLCIFYLLFIFLYFRQYEEKLEAEQKNRLIELKSSQYEKELAAIRRSEREISIIRHDMRHFLLNISAYIKNGESEKAQEYIDTVIASADKTVTRKYCRNEIVNISLSSHEEKIASEGIQFDYAIDIPDILPFSDVDITAILSNAVENAIKAVVKVRKEEKIISLKLKMTGDKLLFSLKNRFSEEPVLVDGVPKAKLPGHGLGTQSIRYMTERLGGNCQFSVKDRWFVLQAIL